MFRDKQKAKEYILEWSAKHRDKMRAYCQKWRDSHPGAQVEATRKWRERNPDHRKLVYIERKTIEREKQRKRNEVVKQQIVKAYGGFCQCCGETEMKFLTLEHVNRDGKAHRAKFKANVYYDLMKRGFPQEGYTILCMNCNWATRYGQTCPHKRFVLEIIGAAI
jgi:hypothetical protein